MSRRTGSAALTTAARELPTVYLRPGEFFFASEPTVITTVLGSCVSVTLFAPGAGRGAMCHASLPFLPPGGCPGDGRYADASVRAMLARFRAAGIAPGELEAKIFGGAAVLGSGGEPIRGSMGEQNVASALASLGAEGVRLSVRDVGGGVGRKLFFFAHTGEVFMRRIKALPAADAEVPHVR